MQAKPHIPKSDSLNVDSLKLIKGIQTQKHRLDLFFFLVWGSCKYQLSPMKSEWHSDESQFPNIQVAVKTLKYINTKGVPIQSQCNCAAYCVQINYLKFNFKNSKQACHLCINPSMGCES